MLRADWLPVETVRGLRLVSMMLDRLVKACMLAIWSVSISRLRRLVRAAEAA